MFEIVHQIYFFNLITKYVGGALPIFLQIVHQIMSKHTLIFHEFIHQILGWLVVEKMREIGVIREYCDKWPLYLYIAGLLFMLYMYTLC